MENFTPLKNLTKNQGLTNKEFHIKSHINLTISHTLHVEFLHCS